MLQSELLFGEDEINIRLKNTIFSDIIFEYYDNAKKNDLYASINKGEPIALDRVFIAGFSINEYRELYNLEKDEIVDIYFDYCLECCFSGSGKTALDLTWCNIICKDPIQGMMIDSCYFINGRVDFSYSKIGDQDLSFRGCKFFYTDLYFCHSIFGGKDIYFNETDFLSTDCDIKFIGTIFGDDGELNFENAENINGTIEFYKADLGNKKLDFSFINAPDLDVIFFDIDTPNNNIEFIDTTIGKIILYNVRVNGLVDFRISTCQHIIIQESIIRDCVILGNRGYRNFTLYCFKGTINLGRIRIQNKFSKKLFDKQLQYAYDYQYNMLVLCPTSSTDKAKQLMVLTENYHNEGETDNEDRAYVLSKRYRSKGRISDVISDFPTVKRNEIYRDSLLLRIKAYVEICFHLIFVVIGFIFEKLFLDIFCGNYATKPSKFLFWMIAIISIFAGVYYQKLITNSGSFSLIGTIYENMASGPVSFLYSLQVFLQIEPGDIIPSAGFVYYISILERIIGISVFSLFVVSYTRKIIK